MPTEKEMLDQLRQGKVKLPPLTFSFLDDHLDVGEGKRNSVDEFLNNPLFDIDIREKPSSNVDWSKYL